MKATIHDKRIEFIDVFRAVGIIFMIMGHIGYGGVFDKWIHAFHMPMFFFVSGFFWRKRNLRELVKLKAKSLLIPYVCFGFAQLVFLSAFSSGYRTLKPVKLLLTNNTDGMQPVPGALWFLTSLFIAEIVYSLIRHLIGREWIAHMVVCLTVLCGTVIPYYFRLPWGADTAFVGIGFMHAGCLFREKKYLSKLLQLKPVPACILGGGTTVLIFLNSSVNLRAGQYEVVPLFWINAIAAIIVGWNLARYLEDVLDRMRWSRISLWLKSIGKNSIVHLCLNQICILVFRKAFQLIGITGIIERILLLPATLGALFVAQQLICGTRLRIMIGRYWTARST